VKTKRLGGLSQSVVTALAGLACAAAAAACGTTIPKVEADRCTRGIADGNDAYTVRQGAACRMIADRYASDDRPHEAMEYARKACQLEDAGGCEKYLSLARAAVNLPPDSLAEARAAGEKACDGIVVGGEETDSRPTLCVRTAELYLDVEPRSKGEAGRLYARACKLGDKGACERAKGLGVEVEEAPPAQAKEAPVPPPRRPRPAPPASVTASSAPGATAAAAGPPPCHERRECVTLELKQRNFSEVVGTMTSHCDHPVACTWCPSKGDQVDKSACRSMTIGPGETRSDKEAGLWYEGFNAMAYDCMDVGDDSRCLSL
jgi:hypothetical protein